MTVADDRGFTLLEVVVALAIFLLALGAISPSLSSAYLKMNQAHLRVVGLNVIDGQMERYLAEDDWSWSGSEQEGEDAGWAWTAALEDYAHETDSDTVDGKLVKLGITATRDLWGTSVTVYLERIIWVQVT